MSKVGLAIAPLLIAAGLVAGGSPNPAAAQQDGWVVNLTPYLWMQGMSGDMTVRGRKASVDDNFFDLLDKSDFLFGAFVHLEARQGVWGG
ncbi:MAG: hypothetical protein AB7O45_03400, partial [Alphaproteobacteria bacterium]